MKLGKNLNVETITTTGANSKDSKIGINSKDGVTTTISVTRDGQRRLWTVLVFLTTTRD